MLEFVVVALVATAVLDFVRVDRTSHSASDTLLAWTPHVGLLILIGWSLSAAIRRRSNSQK